MGLRERRHADPLLLRYLRTCEDELSKRANKHQRNLGRAAEPIRTRTNQIGSGDTPGTSGGGSKGRIAIYSNSPWAPTGYGQQTAQLSKYLSQDGYAVSVISNYGLEATSTDWQGIRIYPRGFDAYSNDVISAHARHWFEQEPDVPNLLLTLYDVWVIKNPSLKEFNVASWVPIDHMPIPVEVLKYCRQDFVHPIAMSKFGSDQLTKHDVEHSYAPHGIETIYRPTEYYQDGDEKTYPRDFMEVGKDDFVVTINSANKGIPPRKGFAEMFLAFSLFAADKPDAKLYVHTERDGAAGGIRLLDLMKSVGLTDDKVKFVNQYAIRSGIPPQLLAAIYTTSDVFLCTSLGEGFGIPVIEAAACGTKVIVTNATAQPELVGEGWLVDGQPWWDALQSSWWVIPNVQEIVSALEEAYLKRGRSETQIQHAAEYEASNVYRNHWQPIIEKLLKGQNGNHERILQSK